MSAQQRAELDATTLDQLLAGFRALGERFSTGKSAYRGVSWKKAMQKWNAQIGNKATGKRESLGYFDDETQAARAYDARAAQLHGRCAGLASPGLHLLGGAGLAASPPRRRALPLLAPAARPSSTSPRRRRRRRRRQQEQRQAPRPQRRPCASSLQLVRSCWQRPSLRPAHPPRLRPSQPLVPACPATPTPLPPQAPP
jgi:hypothetical protein